MNRNESGAPTSAKAIDLTGLDASTQEYLRSLWIAEDYDAYFATNLLFQFDIRFLERLFPMPLKLLDLGCGTGRILIPFAKRGYDVTGVDLSDFMLQVASEKLEAEGLSARLVRSNLCRIPELSDASFDAAICMFSTVGMIRGHVNRLSAVREACRLLKPGGFYVFHAHNFLYEGWKPETWQAWFHSLCLALFHGYELGDKILPIYRSIPNMFLHVFRPGEMRRLLVQAGLQPERQVYLTRDRNAELGPVFFRSLRANGFIAIARKPGHKKE